MSDTSRYRGVPVLETLPGDSWSAWKRGVDAALNQQPCFRCWCPAGDHQGQTGCKNDDCELSSAEALDPGWGQDTDQGQDTNPDKTRGGGQDTYRGVPKPENIVRAEGTGFQDDPYVIGWKDGVDAHWDRTVRLAAERDKDKQDRMPPELSVFQAVMEDRTRDARRLVAAMSGRDRAVLSFWLRGLSGVLEDAEADRRLLR